jgi:hypothetical protein
VIKEDKVIPPKTTIAIEYLLSAPAPLLITRGTAPKRVDIVVIKTGLNLIKDDSKIASSPLIPYSLN